MKRIRYIKNGTGYESAHFIKAADGTEYKSRYIPMATGMFKAVVERIGTGTIIEFTSGTEHSVKKMLKKALTELGCSFDDETRVRE